MDLDVFVRNFELNIFSIQRRILAGIEHFCSLTPRQDARRVDDLLCNRIQTVIPSGDVFHALLCISNSNVFHGKDEQKPSAYSQAKPPLHCCRAKVCIGHQR